ncbi:MAG: hypothetical protein GY847_29210 [Proteobacteria bacterium]|nr:hypothetical protein [Pseudomonadota bacterium]
MGFVAATITILVFITGIESLGGLLIRERNSLSDTNETSTQDVIERSRAADGRQRSNALDLDLDMNSSPPYPPQLPEFAAPEVAEEQRFRASCNNWCIK